MESLENKRSHPGGTLGTFAGVFTPSILTILGIILFLRTGFVVGNAGLSRALLIISIANLISILTSVSLSAVATNLKVKSGGDYYLISRTLGLEFGGAIGIILFLAQSVSIAFYCIGFGEALSGSGLVMGKEIPAHLIAFAAIAFLFIFAWMGSDWATKFQYGVMALLLAALASFYIGGFLQWDGAVFRENWSTPDDSLPFWVLFALFFPAVTGFTQGVSMSGDLKNPGKSLPLGTFMAVGISLIVYFSAAVVFSGALPNRELSADYSAMYHIASLHWLVDAGVIAATLSSAMASFLGAPRILQSLAADRIFPYLHFFAKGVGSARNPRRAVLLAAGIACLTVALGNLNLIAPVVSMFFLISYGLLNYATYYEARTTSPSFRPTFRYFDRRLSLLGFLACLLAMLAIDPKMGLIAISILFAIFQYLRRTADPARWADSTRAYHLQRTRENLLAANVTPAHPRDWRPQILVFSEDSGRRPWLLRLSSWIEGGSGLTTVVTILEGKDLLLAKEKEELEKSLQQDIKEHNSAAFSLVLTTTDIGETVHTLLQAHGIGPLRPNTIVLNWLDNENKTSVRFRELLFGQQLKTLHRQGCNIVVLYSRQKAWEILMNTESEQSVIDVWWPDDATGNLMLLFAYLMTRSDAWKGASIRVLAFRSDRGRDEQERGIQDVVSEARIDAEILFAESREAASILEMSEQATFVFLPFSFRGNLIHLPVGNGVEDLLEQLPPTAMVLAAEDIELDAEPEEGTAAELAVARDMFEKRSRLVKAAEKELSKAEKDASKADELLQEALDKEQDAQDEALIEKLTNERDRALERVEQNRRRVSKMLAKAEEARASLNESDDEDQREKMEKE